MKRKNEYELAILNLGYDGYLAFALKFAIPILAASAIGTVILFMFFNVPAFVPFMFLGIGLCFTFFYPTFEFEKKKVDIHENVHLFITYLGTMATLDVSREIIFRKVADSKRYGEISSIFEKILYLAKKWNLGYALTCRKVAILAPSKIMADFLDRLAAVIDFGEDLGIFLLDEQDAVLEDYSVEYHQSIENIKLVQDVFVSLTIALAFGMASALLVPLLVGIPLTVVVQYGLVGLVFTDILLIILVKTFIPSDALAYKGKAIDEGSKKLRKWTYILGGICAVLLPVLYILAPFGLLVNLTIGFAPLFILGLMGMKEEKLIIERDLSFPVFIRALGSTIYTRGGGVVGSIGALRIHDFGPLDVMKVNLYRRLRLASDKDKSWAMFAGETASHLIHFFTPIFYESIYLGGNAEKIGKIISDNFTKVLSLRKMRLQAASSMRGSLYGGLFGFVSTVYMSVGISNLLARLFGDISSATDLTGEAASLFASILPAVPVADTGTIDLLIAIMVIIHAIASSVALKIVDGGKNESGCFDYVIMMVIGAVISVIVPMATKWAFGSVFSNGG